MAEAFAKKYWGDSVTFQSAGTNPADTVNPFVSKVMEEKGLDISNRIPGLLTQEIYDNADKIITMGCSIKEICPTNWELAEDWALDDPEGKTLNQIRYIRDEIEIRVISFTSSIGHCATPFFFEGRKFFQNKRPKVIQNHSL